MLDACIIFLREPMNTDNNLLGIKKDDQGLISPPPADIPPYSEQNLYLVIGTFLAEMAKESKCIVCASHFPSLAKNPVSIPDDYGGGSIPMQAHLCSKDSC